MDVIKFFDYAVFTQKIKILDTGKPITGYLNYMTCDKKRCLPPKDVDFEFEFPLTSDSTQDSGTEKAVEKPKTPPTEKTSASLTSTHGASDGHAGKTQISVTEKMPTDKNLIKPVVWTVGVVDKSDGTYEMTFDAAIDDTWKIYSQHSSPDDGRYPRVSFLTRQIIFLHLSLPKKSEKSRPDRTRFLTTP